LKESECAVVGTIKNLTGIRLKEILTRADRIVRVLGFLEQVHREPEELQQPQPETKPETKPIPQSNLNKLTSIPDLNRYILDFLD
jgi:hypothetical protein